MSKRKFVIVTDSSCDMPQEYLQQNEIEVVNLGFTMGNVNYEGEFGEKISIQDFYAKLREGAMPTTYQVTAETAKMHIEPYLKDGKDILIIAFSGALSGTAGSFLVAAKEMKEKYPDRKILSVDSLCASMGEGLLLDYVIRYADGGAEIEEAAKYAEDLKLHICHEFTVDNLFHLKRGGRVSGVTAVIGTILKIKPLMHVSDEGKLVPIGKAMGRKKSLNELVEAVLEKNDMSEDDPIFISHGDCLGDVEYVQKILLEKFPNKRIVVNYVGAVIGAHSGCGTLAIFYKGKHR